MARIRITCVDPAKLAVEAIDKDDADTLEAIRNIPTRVYQARWRHWEVPLSDENIEYMRGVFPDRDCEMDDDSRIAMRYVELRAAQATKKAERRWEYVFDGVVPEIPYKSSTEPYKHQVVCLDAVHGSEFFGIFMEMGTGKTWVALNEIRWCAQEAAAKAGPDGKYPSYKVLIAAPNGVCATWIKEMKKHWPADFNYEAWNLGLLPWGLDQMIEFAKSKAKVKILVCGLDRLATLTAPVDGEPGPLHRLKFNVFIVDESARIKNPSAKRSKACQSVADVCAARRIIMTGTPVVNNILDLYSQFQFLSPGVLGFDSFNSFKNHHAVVEKYEGRERIRTFLNVEELKAKMAKYSFVVKKEDCLDLPPKVYEIREIEMGEKQLAMYKQMLEWFVAALNDISDTANTTEASAMIAQLTRLRQICGGFIKNPDGEIRRIPDATGKQEQLIEDLEDLPGKVIIWRAFQYDAILIREALEKAGVKWTELLGETPAHLRTENEDKFNMDEECKVLIADAGLAGEGRTLLGSKTQRCSTSIFWSCDFSLGKRLQAEDRNHRIGQDGEKVLYLDYVCQDSIEEKIVKALNAKKDLAAILTDLKSIKDLLFNPLEM